MIGVPIEGELYSHLIPTSLYTKIQPGKVKTSLSDIVYIGVKMCCVLLLHSEVVGYTHLQSLR